MPKQATRPRHAAPKEPVSRTVMLPAVLLTAAGTAFAGLAMVPPAADDRPVQRVVAASASTPLGIADPGVELPTDADVLNPSEESVKRAAAEARRLDAEASRLAAEKAAAEKAAADRAAAEKAEADKAAAQAAVASGAPPRASRDRNAAPPPNEAKNAAFVRPGDGRLTSGFGRRWGRLHAGIDLAAGTGSPIRAVAAGTVVSAGQESGYGNVVRLRHADGTETVYAHLSRILVRGGKVAAGQQIGKEGNTGRSTGPHLHFEVRVNGAPVNPLAWLRARGVRV